MGAIADYDTLRSLITGARQKPYATKLETARALTCPLRSMWVDAPFAGATPSTAVVPTKATTGDILGGLRQDAGTSQQWLAQMNYVIAKGGSGNVGMVMLYDRVSHQGGLSGTVTGAQTTNLPTAALTRYTSGVGVIACAEIYSSIGTTATTGTISYTNHVGTTGRTSESFVIGGTTFNAVAVMIPIPLQIFDQGVRSVESVTLAASTGTAGNFGITLIWPLAFFLMRIADEDQRWLAGVNSAGAFPEILDDACLALAYTSSLSGHIGQFEAEMRLVEA
jgi:hypothetical protein